MILVVFLQRFFFKLSTFFYLWAELGFRKTLSRYVRASLGVFFKRFRLENKDATSKSLIPSVTDTDLELLLGETSLPTPTLESEILSSEWVWATPIFGKGSGGHHDIFMLANTAQERGIKQKIGLTQGNSTLDIGYFKNVIRNDYGYETLALDDLDVSRNFRNELVIATGWQTFAPAMQIPAKKRAYLVQDFEPWFNPAGIQSYLAEQTYKFEIPCLTAGPWLANLMAKKYGAKSEYFDLGYDPQLYKNSDSAERDAIVIYYRPGTLRRASDFALEVIRSAEKQLSDFEIHFVGGRPQVLPQGNVTVHGSLSHDELSELYQKAAVTFVLSMTNTSLVPVEALAAGSSVLTNSGQINEMNLAGTFASFADLNLREMGKEIVKIAKEMNQDKANENAKSVLGREWNVQSAKAIEYLQELPHA
jgi:glycosyltransferase involved in cell wall biosynthesis